MGVKRYIELKFGNNKFTEPYLINDILIKNKFNWLIDAEIENARIELFKDSGGNVTLIWNAGTWISGTWEYGVFRGGEWRFGTWNNGVWYNGVWKNGTFNTGIIFGGKFLNGKIEGGDIRGGQMFDIEIGENVKNNAKPIPEKTNEPKINQHTQEPLPQNDPYASEVQKHIENSHFEMPKKKKPLLDIASLKKKFDELQDKSRFTKMMKFTEFTKNEKEK